MSYLNIKNVSKSFGSKEVLSNINLDIQQGELVCFLGPSGCGKTTLLRIIAGLEQQNSGTLTQAGHDISSLPAIDRDYGIVFQSYALFPNLTVSKNIAFALKSLKLAKSEQKKRIEELLELVGLADHKNKHPNQLSGGQQQRVALARALALNPGLLLLDEPLSALDAKVRQFLRGEIKKLQQRLGVTTIMVTHDQEEALAMADRIVVMNHGCIEQVGTPEDIYQRPISKFVADFIGSINFFDNDQFAIRPEHISLSLSASEKSRAVEVAAVEYLGSFTRFTVKDEHGLYTVDIDSNEASAMAHANTLHMHWLNEHVLNMQGAA
ncbi:ABC transporter ATP-binding protein [Salinibius halmophilus]|uniref:ABC transporter ATP-binding protein n=1 Tax=Salinibius halmophilus TaxID=1853216 RepID=UPI000E6684C5|nr:ATP-binding cassette domain-containing protein [Salinibius halmophilus]